MITQKQQQKNNAARFLSNPVPYCEINRHEEKDCETRH
jgi:hypothetical protein